MNEPRTKCIDPDYRKDPKTDHFCCRCQKDIRGAHRFVHLVNGGPFALHPEDESKYIADSGDLGSFPIGPDCARKIGVEWTTE
jgi:hypothetical protein